jgi:glutamate-1-semialdehyde aminotransferase
VLIFDEIRTGFRVAVGGAQAHYGITPDISTFGKAMANGYPISAVVGKVKFMDVCEKKVFISSTFFPNSLEMAASMKCIEILQRDKIIDMVWAKGKAFLRELEQIVSKINAPAQVSGIPPMPYLTFNKVDDFYKERRERFYTETIRRGLFIQPYHHWYISARHTETDLEKALAAIREALQIVMGEYPLK